MPNWKDLPEVNHHHHRHPEMKIEKFCEINLFFKKLGIVGRIGTLVLPMSTLDRLPRPELCFSSSASDSCVDPWDPVLGPPDLPENDITNIQGRRNRVSQGSLGYP